MLAQAWAPTSARGEEEQSWPSGLVGHDAMNEWVWGDWVLRGHPRERKIGSGRVGRWVALRYFTRLRSTDGGVAMS